MAENILPGFDFFSSSPDHLIGVGEIFDAETLAAICGAVSSPPTAVASSAAALGTHSFAYKPGDLSSLLDPEEGLSDDDGPQAKKTKGGNGEAVKSKANKEKARRERLNDRFTELAKLIEPGQEPKTDKLSILNDAVKFVKQLTAENHQVKMLNKFLEERVAHHERERGQALYQQSLMMQQQHPSSLAQNGDQMIAMIPARPMHHSSMPGPSSIGSGVASTSGSFLHQAQPQMMQRPVSPCYQMTSMQPMHQQSTMQPMQPMHQNLAPHTMQQYQQQRMLIQQPQPQQHVIPQQQPLQNQNQPELGYQQYTVPSSMQPLSVQGMQPLEGSLLRSLDGNAYPKVEYEPELDSNQVAQAVQEIQFVHANLKPNSMQMPQQSQWISPSMLDMAHDSLLRPPVA